MRVFIADDDVLIAEHLAEIVQTFGYQLAGMAHSKEEVLQMIDNCKPDIALLDIAMENKYDGIEIGEYIIQNNHFPIIYITAHSDIQTIDKALKTKPSGYIIKPFTEADVYTAIQIAVENYNENSSINFIMVKDGYKNIKLFFFEILYITTSNNYIDIQTDLHKYTLRQSLYEILDTLNHSDFIQVHRSFVINKSKISKYDSGKLFIGDAVIPVSRKYIKAIHDLLV